MSLYRAKLWEQGLAAMRTGDLENTPGIALDAFNAMRRDLGMPEVRRLPTGEEIRRAREMREAGKLPGDADVPMTGE